MAVIHRRARQPARRADPRLGRFRDLQPWVDVQFAQSTLFTFEGSLTGGQWAHLAVTGMIWLIIPLAVGLRFVTRVEVK
jgi:ABC-2 type transport system permease protein